MSGLSNVQVDKYDNYFIPPSVDLAHHQIVHAKVGKGGISLGTPWFCALPLIMYQRARL